MPGSTSETRSCQASQCSIDFQVQAPSRSRWCGPWSSQATRTVPNSIASSYTRRARRTDSSFGIVSSSPFRSRCGYWMQRRETLRGRERGVRLVQRQEKHALAEINPAKERLELVANHRVRVHDREAVRREMKLLRIRRTDHQDAEALVAFRPLEGRDLLQGPVATAAGV